MFSEKDILALTYHDRATISRETKARDENGITRTTNEIIYENVKCAFSKKDEPLMNGDIASITTSYKIFTFPNVQLKAGDTVEITQFNNNKLTCTISSKPFFYNSHVEALAVVKDRT